MLNHAHFEIGKYVRLTLKDGSMEEGRIVDIYDVRGDEFVTLLRQGSLFHNPVAIDKVQAVEELLIERPQVGKTSWWIAEQIKKGNENK